MVQIRNSTLEEKSKREREGGEGEREEERRREKRNKRKGKAIRLFFLLLEWVKSAPKLNKISIRLIVHVLSHSRRRCRWRRGFFPFFLFFSFFSLLYFFFFLFPFLFMFIKSIYFVHVDTLALLLLDQQISKSINHSILYQMKRMKLTDD